MLRVKNYALRTNLADLAEAALADYRNALEAVIEPNQVILQGHLYLEQLLARIIIALLPRGKEVLESAQWSFQNKLLIVYSIDILPPGVFEAAKAFNSLRNRMAHRLRYEITLADIQSIAQHMPSIRDRVVSEAKQHHPLSSAELLTLSLLGAVAGVAIAFENADPPNESAQA